jgi:hypothetical protein
MNTGRTIFAQLMDHLPLSDFRRCVQKYRGEYKVKSFSCLDQFLCMAFAQLTYRESLRDIEACLRAQRSKLYHMGIRGRVSRNTLSNANMQRDWRIYAEFAQVLIAIARALYLNDDFGVELKQTAYALDATVIDLCLATFPWARFRQRKGGIKLHTLLDLRGSIPTFIHISDAKFHEVNSLDLLPIEPGAFYIMDRGYIDFLRLYRIHSCRAFFVIRQKTNMDAYRIASFKVNKRTGLRCDQMVKLNGFYASRNYPEAFRRIKYFDKEENRTLVFLTNNTDLPALTIAGLYRCRWQVELFFKWIKQHLRIKAFFGTSENTVKTQVWIAISIYVLVAIVKKRMGLEHLSLYTILQVFSISLFEKMPIAQAFAGDMDEISKSDFYNQLNLFD